MAALDDGVRMTKNCALVDSNCSIPGADAAPIDWFYSLKEAEASITAASQWVEELPVGTQYRSELTGEWVS